MITWLRETVKDLLERGPYPWSTRKSEEGRISRRATCADRDEQPQKAVNNMIGASAGSITWVYEGAIAAYRNSFQHSCQDN